MRVHKAHGTGNDFVVVPDLHGTVALTAAQVAALCDRRTGVGGDGMLRLAPAAEGVEHGASGDDHVFMDYRNADGSPAEMCGNGLRVVARHLYDHGWTSDTELRIGSRAGTKQAWLRLDADDNVVAVTVDLGAPAFAGPDLPPVGADGHAAVDAGGTTTRVLPVSMGNPHAVVTCRDPLTAPVTTLGPAIEASSDYPHGTNVEFVHVLDATHVDLRVWERGVGETQACGTGVCGAVAALAARGALATGTEVTVTVPGGTLLVRWDGGVDDPVLLTGPAEEVARIDLAPGWLARAGVPFVTGSSA